MRIPYTYFRYILKQFVLNFLVVLSALSILLLLIDAMELFRRTADRDVPFWVIAEMLLLKYPLHIQKVLSFIVMIAGVSTYTRLTRHQELAVSRAAGISVWQFLMPSVLFSFALGVLLVTVFNPLACVMALKYERLENKYFHGRSSYLALSGSGLWLRQKLSADGGNATGETILYARDAASTNDKEIELNDVIIFVFEKRDQFTRRIDAKTARLLDEFWQLKNVIISEPNGLTTRHDEYFLETNLTVNDIQNSFASPDTISFWELPQFIETLKKSGFSALAHRLRFQQILVSPLLFVAMVFIAALFSLRPPRQGGVGLLITGSILAGFLIYFLTNLVSSLGLSGSMPIFFSAWAPVGVTLLVGVGLLLHFEDG